MATGCPCGATPKSAYGLVDYLTEDLIEAAVASVPKLAKYRGLLAPYALSAIHVQALCAAPREQMPTFELIDFVDVVKGWPKIAQALNSALYPLLCDCDPCPPISTCNTGTCIGITPQDNGWPRPGTDGLQYQYSMPTGTDIYITRGDGACMGFENGILVTWLMDPNFDPRLPVQICDGNGNNCFEWFAETYGQGMQLCFDGPGSPSGDPWSPPPEGIADWIGPPACTTDDICTALDFVYQTVRRTEFLAQVAAGPIFGATTPYTFNLPGVNSITGTLATALPRALEALGAVQPSQLVNPQVTVVSAPALLELDNVAYVEVELTTVPVWMGYRGADDSLVYHVTGNTPGPGWLVVMGQEGVIAYYDIRYGEGLEFAVPATATAIAMQLTPGVEVSLTTWERHV